MASLRSVFAQSLKSGAFGLDSATESRVKRRPVFWRLKWLAKSLQL